jgi:putative hemolysin
MNTTDSGSLGVLLFASVGVLVGVSLYLLSIAASIAVARGRKGVLKSMVDEEYHGASKATVLVEQAERYLLCTQFGRLIASIAVGCFLTLAAYEFALLVGLYRQASSGLALIACIAAAYAIVVGLLLVAVQVVKSIAFEMPERVLCMTGLWVRMFASVSAPILVFAARIIERVLLRWGIEASHERELKVSSAELGEIVKISSEAGVLEENEGHILEGVAELSERTARDVMTPRSEVVWVRRDSSTRQVLGVCTRESVSRLLVCGGDLDDVCGVLLSKDLLTLAGERFEDGAWRSFIRPAFRVPDTKVVRELLVEFQTRRVHFSVVLNEHGEVVGVVTLEDLVEEIVGEIFDEFDNPFREVPVIHEQEGVLYLDGSVPVEALAERLEKHIPEVESQTVSGFICEHLGRLPVSGDSFSVSGVTFTILEVHRNTIKRLSVAICPDYEDPDDSDFAVGVR